MGKKNTAAPSISTEEETNIAFNIITTLKAAFSLSVQPATNNDIQDAIKPTLAWSTTICSKKTFFSKASDKSVTLERSLLSVEEKHLFEEHRLT